MHSRYSSFDGGFVALFSQSVAFVFPFLAASVAERKFLLLMRFNLLVFPFMDYAFGVKSNPLPSLKS